MTLYRRIENEHLTAGGQYLAGYFEIVDAPVLQPVTPEAIKELEGEEARTICVLSRAGAKTMAWLPSLGQWLSKAGHDSPLEWQWFIELSTLKEVQQ